VEKLRQEIFAVFLPLETFVPKPAGIKGFKKTASSEPSLINACPIGVMSDF
jgi:hypothetical protein